MLALTLLTAAPQASAADIRLGLQTTAALGCQVAGVRGGVYSSRLGLYGQVAYCKSGDSSGASFGAGISFDVAHINNFTPYLLAGIDTLPTGSLAVNAGLGLRYSTPLLPIEGYIEGGAQFINSALLGTLPGPRLALGLNYRLSVDNLQGRMVADPLSAQPESIQYSGSAPAECNLTPEQDAAAARGVAQGAASSGVSDAVGAYSAAYSGVGYTVKVGGVSINGNSAKVSGSVKLSATQRSNGKAVGGTYGGTITLTRQGCGWRATGYTRG